MASPQLKNGFTRIANAILDALSTYHCSGGQMNIILVVIRTTYGFHRSEHDLSEGYLAKLTNRHKTKVASDVAALIEKKVLIEVKAPTWTKPRIISLNKNYEEWQGYKSLPVNESETVNENTDGTVSGYTAGTVNENVDHIKDNIKERRKKPSSSISYRVKEENKSATPASDASASWYKNAFFDVTLTFKDELATTYNLSDDQMKAEFDKMESYCKEHKGRVKHYPKFIAKWLGSAKIQLNHIEQVSSIPVFSSISEPWQDG